MSSLKAKLGVLWRRSRPQWLKEAARRPHVLRRWYRWQRVHGKRVKVFYVPDSADREEVRQIARGCDETLERVSALLGVKPVKWRVLIFLYPDMHSFQRCEQIQSTPFHAMARGSSVSAPFMPWQQLGIIMAHELTHVVSYKRIAWRSVGLLEEGLARYVECKLYPFEELPPIPRLDVPLQTLAHHPSFWSHQTNHDLCSDTYCHAHSLALYLIQRSGLNGFLEVYRASGGRKASRRQERFIAAIRKKYGVTLEEFERQWRQDSVITIEGTMLCWDWVLPTAQRALRNSQEQAQQQQSATVEAEHLLHAILLYPDSTACRLLSRIVPIEEALQSIASPAVHERSEKGERPCWAADTRQCVAFAIDEARSLRCTYIGTEHLLLGMMRQQTNAACIVLTILGLDVEGLRSAAHEHYQTTTPCE